MRYSSLFWVLSLVVFVFLMEGTAALALEPTTKPTMAATRPLISWDLSKARNSDALPWPESPRTRRAFEKIIDGEVSFKVTSDLTIHVLAHRVGFYRNQQDIVMAAWIQSSPRSYEAAFEEDVNLARLFKIDPSPVEESRAGTPTGRHGLFAIVSNVPPLPGQPTNVHVKLTLEPAVIGKYDGKFRVAVKLNYIGGAETPKPIVETRPNPSWDLSKSRNAKALPWRESPRTKHLLEWLVHGQASIKITSRETIRMKAHRVSFYRDKGIVRVAMIESSSLSYNDAIDEELKFAKLLKIDPKPIEQLRTLGAEDARRYMAISTTVPPPGQPANVSVSLSLQRAFAKSTDRKFQVAVMVRYKD